MVHPVAERYGVVIPLFLIALLVLAAPAGAMWSTTTIDSSNDVGGDTSIAIDSAGNPRISYFDYSNFDLKYAAGSGGGAWTVTTVDSSGNVGSYSSLALDAAGNPRISYCDYTNLALKYAERDSYGTWSFAAVDTGAGFWYTSLALDAAGNPRISYYDNTNSALKYAERTGGSGTPWNIITVHSGNVGEYSSLALNSAGNPRISYYDKSNHILKYAERTGGSGTSWDIITVDNSAYTGEYCSLALDSSGNPRISYFDGTSLNLKYAERTGGSGTSWNIIMVDSGNVEYHSSLALDSFGNPRIGYSYFSPAGMKYAERNGGSWTITTVDSSGVDGWYVSLALDAAGNPHMSYYDSVNGDLKYSGRIPLVTSLSGTPVTGAAPLTVAFTGTAANAEGSPSWAWSFGDGGTALVQNPSHTYTAPGTYSISLSATDTRGMNVSARQAYITVTGPGTLPVVSGFTASPSSGDAPLTVAFTDTSANSPTSYYWNFGSWSAADGGVSTQPNPMHTYDSPGTYVVSLSARNANGGDTFNRTITVTDPNPHLPPVSSFTATPASGDAPLMVTFTGTSTGGPTGYHWNFGSWSAADGGVSTQPNPAHTYDSPGTYVVTLTVQNADGGDTSSQTITVASSGSATAIAVDPVQPATVYAGIDGSGVYSSPDSGSSWTHLTLPTGADLRIRALAPVRLAGSPATTLYAGSYGGGVYRSADGGITWSTCGLLPDQNVLSLVANATAGVYAGTESGVYASTDGCTTWTALDNGLP
jgi:PKD repeat protein